VVQRIEQAFAALGARFADAGQRLGCASAKQAAGSAWATFLGAGSPLSHVVGADGQLTRQHLEHLEHFFFSRGADAVIEVAAIWQLEPWLTSRGYELAGSEQVMTATLRQGANYAAQPEVIDCSDRLDAWSLAVQTGFGMRPTADGQLLGRILASETPLGILRDGQLAASAAHAMVGDVGYCFADSTLEGFRGLGLQQTLIRHRLWLTAEAGGQYCVAETLPGSGSQRNYARCGFEPAFVRQTFIKRLVVGNPAVREA
jgi:GNAT superfamily N-acetyltransferase